jgi:hypothetical protein
MDMRRDLDENPILLLIASLLLFWTMPLLPWYYDGPVSKFFLDFFPALAVLGSFGYNIKEMRRSSSNPTAGNYILFIISGILSVVMIGRLFGVV